MTGLGMGDGCYVAVIAHDMKKPELAALVERHREAFSICNIVSTQSTGSMLSERFGLCVLGVLAGPSGGDLQIGAKVVQGEIAAVIFLRDVASAHPHEADIAALLRVCDAHNIPYATNVATAELIVNALVAGGRRSS